MLERALIALLISLSLIAVTKALDPSELLTIDFSGCSEVLGSDTTCRDD